MAVRFTRSIGMLLLGIYLVLTGLISLFGLSVPALLTGLLALLAGVLILVGR